jgi:hypothetical protein
MRFVLPFLLAPLSVGSVGCVQDMIDQGAARMAIMAAGSVTNLTSVDEGCGFASLNTMLFNISQFELAEGGVLETSWTIDGCRLGSEVPVTQTNCLGDTQTVTGMATVTGTQHLQLKAGLPPGPASAKAVSIHVDEADVYGLEMTNASVSAPDQSATVKIHRGTVSATIEPVLGESASSPGLYSVPTPVARISNVRLQDAELTIVAQGTEIDVHVDDSDLTATSGPFAEGDVNHIEGFIEIDGRTVTVDGDLEENFDLDAYEDSYACAEDLAAPIR